MKNDLYEKTSRTHHDATNHPFGKKLIEGDVTVQEWADWMMLQYQVYDLIDPILPDVLKRRELLCLDLLAMMPVIGHRSLVFDEFVRDTDITKDFYVLAGLMYLMIGINLRGSQIVSKKVKTIPGVSCLATTYTAEESSKGNAWVKDNLRGINGLSDFTHKSFDMMLDVMEEIFQRNQ